MIKLGVNVDHIATIRQMRMSSKPDPVYAACLCEQAGADSIVFHLREDRRHIQERDIKLMKEMISIPLNMEMSIASEIVSIATEMKPDQVTLVPEKREELTTEGGLNVIDFFPEIQQVIKVMNDNNIKVSLFIDPDLEQIKAAKEAGVDIIELHTGRFAQADRDKKKKMCFDELAAAASLAEEKGLKVAAGHGLDYNNILPLLSIPEIEEFNIGYSIIGRALFVGIEEAVYSMKALL